MKPKTRRALFGVALAAAGVAGLFMTTRGDWALVAVIVLGVFLIDMETAKEALTALSPFKKSDG